MDFPGEKLLTKMWETLTEKGIGSLLGPWQMRREERARIDVRKEELLALAQAERDADDIRSGRKRLTEERTLAALPSGSAISQRHAPEGPDAMTRRVTRQILADAILKEVNVTRALLAAEAELETNAQEPPDRKVDDDWLFRWREGAGAVTQEQLQQLWGRVLAGELKSPGTFSLRTLDFLRNLSPDEAARIVKLSRFIVADAWIVQEKDLLDREGITFEFLVGMEELGIITAFKRSG